MTRKQTTAALARLAATWPARQIGDATIDEYQAAWEELPAAAVQAAIDRWLREEKFFPAPGEIASRARGGRQGQEADWGLGRCAVCGRPAGMRIRERRACWEHADAVFPEEAELEAIA